MVRDRSSKPRGWDSSVAWYRLYSHAGSSYIAGVAALSIVLLLSFGPPNTSSEAQSICDKYVSTNGSDKNAGTHSLPFRTPQKLVDSLASGQVGCFRRGTYTQAENKIRITRAGIKLRNAPGERATIRAGIHVLKGANGVVVRNLNLDGSRSPRCAKGDTCAILPSPIINANYTKWIGNNVTNKHTAICFNVGSQKNGSARGTLIRNNRIHNCGRLPATNLDHGIYLNYTNNTRILDNIIYDNADRGIQLRANADNTIISRNIIDGNGQGIIFSGDFGTASDNTTVRNNIISNSSVRHNVEHWYPSNNPVGRKNFVKNNCLWASHPESYYRASGGVKRATVGYTARQNIVKAPRYVNRSAKNFRLRQGSPCKVVLR